MSEIRTYLAGCTTMAAALAALAAMFALTGAKAPATARFDHITVGRIDIEEPDGTKRLVISNRTQFPGDFTKGKENPRPDRRADAGMLFLNDEGTENGGLTYHGSEKSDGAIATGMSLTFDRFRQDQALALSHGDDEHSSSSGVVINDLPFYRTSSIEDIKAFVAEAAKLPAADRDAYFRRKQDEGLLARNRIYLGTMADQSASLTLKDAKGRPRMVLLVSAQGRPEIHMLDEAGRVVKVVAPDN